MNNARTGEWENRESNGRRGRLWLVEPPSTEPNLVADDDPNVGVSLLDADLMQQLRGGDSAAFASLYDRYAPQVHGIARSILRDNHLAEEATHDVFLNWTYAR